jgi:hypothetical protein
MTSDRSFGDSPNPAEPSHMPALQITVRSSSTKTTGSTQPSEGEIGSMTAKFTRHSVPNIEVEIAQSWLLNRTTRAAVSSATPDVGGTAVLARPSCPPFAVAAHPIRGAFSQLSAPCAEACTR